MISASFPSPSQGVWFIGPFPLRAYAIAIIIGIFVAYAILKRRYVAKGGPAEPLVDIAFWAVLAGILGARLYHVITDHQLYFGPGKNPWRALAIWEGGLGIWGAVLAGAVGVTLAARHVGLRTLPIADALAPALLVAQAIGRLGNYFNQELFGKPTNLPWALRIDPEHLPAGYPVGTTFHPTFLYEMLWCLAGAALLLLLERRFHLVAGQLFAAYIMVYTSGRLWIENLRIDTANHILGLRLNVWTAAIVFLFGLALFIYLRRRYRAHPEVNSIWVSEEAKARYERSLAAERASDRSETADDRAAGATDDDTAGTTNPEPAEPTGATSAGPTNAEPTNAEPTHPEGGADVPE